MTTDRNAVIAKIQAMLKLQESTTFDGEATAAAALIDRLCKQHGISLEEASDSIAMDETFKEFKKMDASFATLLNAVASFYDAKCYLQKKDGKQSYQIIGTEAQQIQTKLYFEYFQDVMEKECELAYQAEKVLAELQGTTIGRSFKYNFRKAFATKVAERLHTQKQEEGRKHEDAKAVEKVVAQRKFGRRNVTSAAGAGASVGSNSGSSVSLNRQAEGRTVKQLAGC